MLKLAAFKLKGQRETDSRLAAGDTSIQSFNERHGAAFSAEDFVRFGFAADEILNEEL